MMMTRRALFVILRYFLTDATAVVCDSYEVKEFSSWLESGMPKFRTSLIDSLSWICDTVLAPYEVIQREQYSLDIYLLKCVAASGTCRVAAACE